MKRLLVVTLLLTGCTTAKPPTWLLYSKASYYYGRMQAKAEVVCAPPVKANLADVCKEAAQDQRLISELAPQIEAELSKSKPDWDVIVHYLEIVLSLASKFVP